MENTLFAKIKSCKFLCSLIIWQDIFSKINVVSKMLPNPNIDINECSKAWNKLK